LAYIRTETNETSEKYRSSQAEEVTLTGLHEDMGNAWGRVSQLAKSSDIVIRQMTNLEKYEKKQLRRSPTIDPSSVCAILFTLLTKEHPGSTRTATGVQPHHRCAKKLGMLIKNLLAIKDLQVRVEAYLMDTFDKGFGFPDIQWTIEQLECRLNMILQMMQNTSKENTEAKHSMNM
jgi:hypothetical protein